MRVVSRDLEIREGVKVGHRGEARNGAELILAASFASSVGWKDGPRKGGERNRSRGAEGHELSGRRREDAKGSGSRPPASAVRGQRLSLRDLRSCRLRPLP